METSCSGQSYAEDVGVFHLGVEGDWSLWEVGDRGESVWIGTWNFKFEDQLRLKNCVWEWVCKQISIFFFKFAVDFGELNKVWNWYKSCFWWLCSPNWTGYECHLSRGRDAPFPPSFIRDGLRGQLSGKPKS